VCSGRWQQVALKISKQKVTPKCTTKSKPSLNKLIEVVDRRKFETDF